MQRVSADHYVGRRVKEIKKKDYGYTVVLDGDAMFNIETNDAPPTLVHEGIGESLLSVILSSSKTTLVFDHTRVEIPPQGYSIVDEKGGITEPVFPQKNDDWRDLTVPEEPKERITE